MIETRSVVECVLNWLFLGSATNVSANFTKKVGHGILNFTLKAGAGQA
jgi:hypothetical protein